MDSVFYEVKMPKSLEEMTWREVQEVLKQTNIAIISTGAIEQHGYHLPLNTDNMIAIELSKRTAKILENDGFIILIGPCLPIGVNPEALARTENWLGLLLFLALCVFVYFDCRRAKPDAEAPEIHM